ncbi:MAG: hypothetical protein VW378_01645 [bacterium]
MSKDLSNENRLSLSTYSKEKLRNINDIVLLRVYINPKQTIEQHHKLSLFKSLIRQMQQINNKIKVEYYDQKHNSSSLLIFYENKRQEIKGFLTTMNMEYSLIREMIKLTNPKAFPIHILFGTEKKERLTVFKKYMEERYSPSYTENIQDKTMSKQLICILGTHLKPEVLKQVYALGQKGANIIIFLDNMTVDKDFQVTYKANTLTTFLAPFNIHVEQGIIADKSHHYLSWVNPYKDIENKPYPYWMHANVKNNQDSYLVPWAVPINIDNSTTKISILMQSSSDYYRSERPHQLGPDHERPILFSKQKPAVLGIKIEKENSQSTLLVLNNTESLTNRILNQHSENIEVVQEWMDPLVLDSELLALKNKKQPRKINEKNIVKQNQLIQLLYFFILPLLYMGIILLSRYYRRKRRKL